MPKLTLEESKAVGGAAAEAEKQAKLAAEKKRLEKTGKSADKVKFKKGELAEGTRVVTPQGETIVGEKNEPAAPKQQLKTKPKPLPKAKPKPTVGRGPGGKIVSLKKKAPATRKKTRSGKKIDVATGRVAVPLVKRGAGGRAVGTTPEERAATIRTEITPSVNAATPEELERIRKQSQPTPAPMTQQPAGTLRGGGQRKLRGFAVSHPRVKAAVDAVLTHLDNMTKTKGTPEFEHHQQLFDAIHENIKKMDPHGLGITIGQLKHQTITGGSKPLLGRLHTLVQDRLEEGRMADEANRLRAQQGRK